MNYKMIGRYISWILLVEAVFMVPALIISLACGEMHGVFAFLETIGMILVVAGILFLLCRGARQIFYAREGFLCVGLGWIVLSIMGCLPFVLSGEIPHFVDALFETVSGFTTTGASILTAVEPLSKGILYWRSFTHWLGGMGVLVFLLALASTETRGDGFALHILRAESPGPSVDKMTPHIRDSAMILYFLYIFLTVLDIAFLLIGKMPVFDAVCTAFGTAGTGGFGVRNDSIAGYSPYIQNVCTVFMLLFGVNFNCYYLLLLRRFRSVVKNEELRLYFGVVLVSILLIAWDVRGLYATLEETFRHSAFQVASIMTTTGFATTDFDLWPSFSKSILLCLMVIGACAGSTGGGLKCGRVLLLMKSLVRSIRKALRPNKVQVIRSDGRTIDEQVLTNTNAYLAAYVIIIVLSMIIISKDGLSVATNFSAVLACFNNIGPGLEVVGPTCNYSMYSVISKLVLIFDMLAGRLEIFPMLALFTRAGWKNT
ncbi:MAG: TrkH family potassium uptake protein [Oscillospiraceae bacterium]|nr:TrkH family potassium uptake protein [Oscillospiraceae bacterium]